MAHESNLSINLANQMTSNPSESPFSCMVSSGFPELLAKLGCTLTLSTYKAGKVILLSANEEGLIQLPRTFAKPMGMAIADKRMAIATREEVLVLVNDPLLARSYPRAPQTYDAFFAPRATFFTGEIDLHDMAWVGNRLIGVNTLFSCLAEIGPAHSFRPLWKPSFVTELCSEDRCHLNGMALEGGKPVSVTALGATNSSKAWRGDKASGGIVMDVESQEIIACGLSMPHSPRIYDGNLYLLNSGTGEVLQVDRESGHKESVIALPGFTRGLARYGDILFVGLSVLRDTRNFGGLPIEAKADELVCGISAVSLSSGKELGRISYQSTCEEIYDVHVMPGMRRPGILGVSDDMHRNALSIPGAAFWSDPEEREKLREAEREERAGHEQGSDKKTAP